MKSFCSIVFIVFVCAAGYGQTVFKGKVVDNLGDPVGNVTIASSDKQLSTVSDYGGMFEITLRKSDTVIVASKIGYATNNVVISGMTYTTIILSDISYQMEEVEVFNTGYQQIARERSTGSFEQLSEKDLQRRIATNILDKLEGMVPGLQYDNRSETPVINIRGINTLSNNMMGPLIVVDNFPFSGNIADINPNDVESVTFLKDAAAASIWGARAGNGVIVINMKKPAVSEQKIRVDITTNLSVLEKPRLFDMPQMSSSDFIELERFLFEKGHYNTAYNNPITSKRTVFSPVVDLLFDNQKGILSDMDMEAAIRSYKQVDVRDDLLKYFYREQVLQQYNASFAGGSSRNAWRFALGYDKNVGGQFGQKDDRITANLQNTLQLRKDMKLTVMSRFAQKGTSDNSARFNYNFTPGGGRTTLYPYARLVGQDGEPLAIPHAYNFRYIESLAESPLLNWQYRPYDEVDNISSNNIRNHLVSQIGWTYNPVSGIELSALYNNELQNEQRATIYGEESFFTRDLINRFSQVNGNTVNYIIPNAGIRSEEHIRLRSHKARLGASFNRSFDDRKHSISAVLGTEISSTVTESNASRFYGYDEHLLNVQAVDYTGAYPIYDGLAANSRIPFVGGFTKYVNRFVSYYGNAAYTLRNKYTVSVSGRRDASNLFGVQSNERWKPLWSSGFSWRLSEEDFLKGLTWLSSLQIRATYGHSGNSGGVASEHALISHSPPNSWNFSTYPFALVTRLPNPSLKWEDVRMINMGLDFGLFNNRLKGSFEYFDKKSTDLITTDEVDPTVGMASVIRNIGIVDGSGFDLSLTTGMQLGRVQWSGRMFLSHSRSKVTEYRGKEGLANAYLSNTGTSLSPLLDKELYPVFGLRFAGLDAETGDPIGYREGEESKDYAGLLRDSLHNIIYYGTALPPYYGSFNQSFSWKGFDVSFLLTFKFGHYFQKKTVLYNSLFNTWNGHIDYSKRWQSPGDEMTTTVPSLVYPASADRDNFYAYAEPNITKGDVLRLQDVRLAYRFNPTLVGQRFRVSAYATVNNVAILWRANGAGLDPDYTNIPQSRRLSLGINCSF